MVRRLKPILDLGVELGTQLSWDMKKDVGVWPAVIGVWNLWIFMHKDPGKPHSATSQPHTEPVHAGVEGLRHRAEAGVCQKPAYCDERVQRQANTLSLLVGQM
jgi:hypothetical protein